MAERMRAALVTRPIFTGYLFAVSVILGGAAIFAFVKELLG